MAFPSVDGKGFFAGLRRHWVWAVLLLLVTAVFLSPWLNRVYVAIQTRVPFLPASRYGS